jgi:hypothetical protein
LRAYRAGTLLVTNSSAAARPLASLSLVGHGSGICRSRNEARAPLVHRRKRCRVSTRHTTNRVRERGTSLPWRIAWWQPIYWSLPSTIAGGTQRRFCPRLSQCGIRAGHVGMCRLDTQCPEIQGSLPAWAEAVRCWPTAWAQPTAIAAAHLLTCRQTGSGTAGPNLSTNDAHQQSDERGPGRSLGRVSTRHSSVLFL